jgi:hypothetical protein
MRNTIFLLAGLILLACSGKNAEEGSAANGTETSSLVTENTAAADPEAGVQSAKSNEANISEKANTSEPLLGERIDGPANIRDAVNGKLLFTLNDGVLVTNSTGKNGWHLVGIMMDIDKSELENGELKKGRKITVDGKEVGELQADMKVTTGRSDKDAWAELIGYTHKDNIKPNSVIETVLADYLKTVSDERSVKDFQDFIRKFELEKTDSFEGYTVYYNYENWLDDPSPMWRTGLVFQKNRLVSILHSRPLKVDGATDHKLSRGFDCLTYDDVANADEIVKMFNTFVNSVD